MSLIAEFLINFNSFSKIKRVLTNVFEFLILSQGSALSHQCNRLTVKYNGAKTLNFKEKRNVYSVDEYAVSEKSTFLFNKCPLLIMTNTSVLRGHFYSIEDDIKTDRGQYADVIGDHFVS